MSRWAVGSVRLLERLLLRSPAGAASENGLPRDWVGPRVDAWLELPLGARHVVLAGGHHPHGDAHRVLKLGLLVEGHSLGQLELAAPGDFDLHVPLPAGLVSPVHVEVRAAPYFIPDEHLGNGDLRQLCFVLHALRLDA